MYKYKIKHVNIYKFKCQLLATAIFSKSVLPFITNMFVCDVNSLDPDQEKEAH